MSAYLVLAVLLALFTASAHARTCTSRRSGDWSSSSTWTGCNGGTPRTNGNDNAVIDNGDTVTLDTNASVQSFTISNNGALVIGDSGTSRSLNVNSSMSVSGTFAVGGNSSGTASHSLSVDGNLTINSGGVMGQDDTPGNHCDVVVSGAFSNQGSYTVGSSGPDFEVDGSATNSGSFSATSIYSLLTFRGSLANYGTFDASNGTTQFTGYGSQTLSGGGTTNFGNLTVNSGGLTLNGNNPTVSGTLTLSSGTFSVGANVLTLNGPAIAGNPARLSTSASSSLVFGGSSAGISVPSGVTALNNLTIANTNGVAMSGSVTVGGTLTLSGGSFAVGSNTLTLNGPAIAGTPANLSTTSASSLAYGGSASGIIVPSGVTALNRLTVNNANGVTLSSSLSVTALVLGSGAVTTGGNILTVSPNCTNSPVSHSAGYVNGYLRLTFPSGTHTCTYDIGSSTAYAPVSLAVSASGSGTLSASTTGNEHPQIASSPIDPTRDANRYWTIGTGGDTLAALVSSYGATFNFISGDLDSVANSGNFTVADYSGGIWATLSPVSNGSLSTGVSGIAGPIVTPTDFAVGEAAATCSVPAGLPSNMTCVCDNFGRSSLNPSTIYGGNWTLSTSSGSFGLPKIVNSGYLRMTDNSNGVATAATMPGTFPAAGNLIQIEFKHYAYSGSGADGVALTLSDANIAPSPGAFGGSLGYAQKSNPGSDCTSAGGCPGFAGGWIGIALDEYGEYSSNTEGRSGGPAPGMTPDAVAIRGSGSGRSGYPYLAGTGSLNPGIDNPNSSNPAYGYLYRIKVDARNYTSANKTTIVSVDRDTSGTGNNYTALVSPFDAFAVNSSQAAVPANWKLSFTGSTGSLTNVHEIGALKICAQTITPPAGYRIQVDNLAPSSCGTPGGSPSSPVVTVTALDNNGNIVTTYNKTVTLSATLSGGSSANASWSLKSGSGTLSGNQYTFASADQGTAQFYLTDTSTQDVYVTVSENGGTIATSTPSTQPIEFSGGTFTIGTDDPLGEGVVAGRTHQMTITRTGCWRGYNYVDTGYSGTEALDGWYVPDQDHPSGALAPQICARNASNTCLPSPGACQTLSIAAPNLSSGSNNVSLAFNNGVANFCLGSSDVGKYSVFLRDDSNVNSPVTGSSDVLTVRPFAVAVSNVTSSNGNNQAGSSPGPGTPVFTAAGANFSATVSGYLWNSSGDANADGLPDSGDNWSQISSGGLAPHYADTVNLSAGTPFAPATPADSPSGTGVAGSVGGGSVAVTNGSTTQLSLTYSEVGSFSLHAQPSTAYLNSSGPYVANLTNRVAIFANPASSAQGSRVGRFRPDHFTFSGTPTIITRSDINSGAGCSPGASGYTYMGEPMRIGFTLEAVALGGSVTQNYAGSYAHLSPGSADWLTLGGANSMGLWMLGDNFGSGGGTCKAVFSSGTTTSFQSCTAATPPAVTRAAGARVALYGTPSSSGWNAGLASFAADALLQRADQADGPYASLKLGIAPQDSDGVRFSSYNLDADNNGTSERELLGTTSVRYGRLSIPSMYGSELLPMPIRLQAQYWNGSAYVNNTDDSCTPLGSGNFSLAGATGGLTTGMTSVQGSGALASGAGTIALSKLSPTPTSKGAVTLAPASGLAAYLPGTGIETFGVYRSGRVIYLREGHY